MVTVGDLTDIELRDMLIADFSLLGTEDNLELLRQVVMRCEMAAVVKQHYSAGAWSSELHVGHKLPRLDESCRSWCKRALLWSRFVASSLDSYGGHTC